MSGLCEECADGDHRHHRPHLGGICIGCPCEFHMPQATLTVRVRVRIEGWVTVSARVPRSFDSTKIDSPGSREQAIADQLTDEAILAAPERLDGECDGFEIVSMGAKP
mgnify:CR=1 FL=1